MPDELILIGTLRLYSGVTSQTDGTVFRRAGGSQEVLTTGCGDDSRAPHLCQRYDQVDTTNSKYPITSICHCRLVMEATSGPGTCCPMVSGNSASPTSTMSMSCSCTTSLTPSRLHGPSVEGNAWLSWRGELGCLAECLVSHTEGSCAAGQRLLASRSRTLTPKYGPRSKFLSRPFVVFLALLRPLPSSSVSYIVRQLCCLLFCAILEHSRRHHYACIKHIMPWHSTRSISIGQDQWLG